MTSGEPARVRLLVSVRSAAEAEAALAGGADLIDVKEPRRGALGAADSSVWNAVRHSVQGHAPVTAALGELLEGDAMTRARATSGLQFAKFGLAGCQSRRGWVNHWHLVTSALPLGTSAVPVAYADWTAADAPAPWVALALAAQSPGRLLLVDTFHKRGGNLLSVFSWEGLVELAEGARQAGVQLALAGSLDAAGIGRLLPLAPAIVGVRGAACQGGRDGAIDAALVNTLAGLVRGGMRKAAG